MQQFEAASSRKLHHACCDELRNVGRIPVVGLARVPEVGPLATEEGILANPAAEVGILANPTTLCAKHALL